MFLGSCPVSASTAKIVHTPARARPAPSAGQSAHTPTRDPRVKPTPSKTSQANPQSTANATPAKPTSQPSQPQSSHRSKTSKHSSPQPSPHPSRRSKSSKDSAPQSSQKSSRSSSKAPQSPPQSSRSSSKASAPQSSKASSKTAPNFSSSSSKGKTTGSRQRKLGEHQMLKDDVGPDAQSFKVYTIFRLPIVLAHLASGCLPVAHPFYRRCLDHG